MKKLLVGSIIALAGLTTQTFAALTVSDISGSPTSLATYLRSLTLSDWASAKSSGTLNAGGFGVFTLNNAIDDTSPNFTLGDVPAHGSLSVESVFKSATYTNEFGFKAGSVLVSNMDLSGGKKITTDSMDSFDLQFFVDTTNMDPGPGGHANPNTYLDSGNVYTLYQGGVPAYYIWMLEDKNLKLADQDYNDFIVLGTLSPVPEPSTIISLIAVGFLGLTVYRHRRKSKAAQAA